MADATPDYNVEQQRLRSQIASLQANLERFKLEVMEIASRERTAHVNIEATEKAIVEHGERLDSLIKAHGKATVPTAKES